MKATKLFTMLAAMICATAIWAQTTVSTDEELRAAIQTGGANITVTADIDLSNSTLSIESGTTITIDLGGHTLDRKLTSRDWDHGGQVITVRKNATLNLSNGTLTGGWGGASGGINNEGGTVNLTDVNITGCTGDDRGGGICNREGGTLTMTGGSITSNTSNDATDPKGGGGLFNASGATATLTGVTITGNEAKVCGGGGICNFGTMTLDGCSISGNTAGTHGAGIWQEGTLNMKGANIISDNKSTIMAGGIKDNLYLYTDKLINVTGSLAGSTIYIDMKTPGVFTGNYHAHNSDIDPATIFQAELPEVMAVTLDGNEAKLGGSLAEGDIYYIDHSGEWGSPVTREVKILHSGEYTLITPGYYEDTDLILSGTYVVTTNDKGYKCHYDGMAYVNADTKIILCDGAKLEVEGSIQLTNGIEFNVYSQAANTGILQNNANIWHKGGTPGIGANMDTRVNMTFHGGTIKAQGETGFAAISGGMNGVNDSKIIVYEANIDATGGSDGPGIGTWYGRDFDASLELCIYGGTVKAKGGDAGAGIGGGDEGFGSNVYVYGGEVYAYGGDNGAGIGGGWSGSGGRLMVYGGIVKAWGGDNGAGIGSGSIKSVSNADDFYGGAVHVYGGEVYAYGGVDAAGIGGGEDSDGGSLEVRGGYVYAEGNDGGAGIGGGQDGDGWWTGIYGGTVIAKAGRNETGYRAIGPGEGSDDYGNLELGDNMMVTSERKFTDAERKNACWYRTQVRVEPCDHQDATASVKDGSMHNVDCIYCKADSATHTFGDDSQCAACKLIRLEDEGDNSALFTKWADGDAHDFFLSGRKLETDSLIVNDEIVESSKAYTVCLPFDMDLSGRDDLMVYTLSYIKDGKEMVFTQTAKKIEAGKPYLIVIHEGELELLGSGKLAETASEGVRVYDWENREQPLGWWRGTLTKIESADAAAVMAYALQSVGDFRRIRPDTPYAWWGAFRSMYCPDELPATNRLTINKGTFGGFGGQNVTVTFEGDADIQDGTGIHNVQCSMFNVQCPDWYDIFGRKLNGKPTQSGIYIVNGKKVLIK